MLFRLRYRDGQLVPTAGRTNDSSSSSRYEGATVDRPSLIISSVGSEDIGNYACVLENDVGVGESNFTSLEVYCKLVSGSSCSVLIE